MKIQDYAIKEEKMILMRQDGILKALRGLTTVEEVVRVTKD
jgi:type II secretory ATPase GspE/PulE/Tfp pilus assembly ATPase PilB-like protein